MSFKDCLCLTCTGFVTLSTSLFMFLIISFCPQFIFMFHLIFLSPHFIDHVSFLFPSIHSPSHSIHLPQSILFMFTLFGCIHITWLFNLIVSFTFQSILSLEINDLRVSSDNFLILDRCSLREAGLHCFRNSLSLYIKQEIQQVLCPLVSLNSNLLMSAADYQWLSDCILFYLIIFILINLEV